MSPAAEVVLCVALVAAAYLLGSLPFALLLGWSRGIDIRKLGSGNIGATNLARNAGRAWGVVAFLLDFSKGLLPVLVALFCVRHWLSERLWLPAAVATAAVLGHIFPLYLRFRGGKGVATAFGAMAVLSWLATLSAGAVWLLAYLATRTVSIASMLAAAALPIAVGVLGADRVGSSYWAVQTFAVGVCLLILVRHRSNVVRLFKGEEFSFRNAARK